MDIDGKIVNLWKHKKPDTMVVDEDRDRNSVVSPFICHICMFLKLKKHDADPESISDISLEVVMRQASLNKCWSRAWSTVSNNKNIM